MVNGDMHTQADEKQITLTGDSFNLADENWQRLVTIL